MKKRILEKLSMPRIGTTADWLALAGYTLIVCGIAMVYKPAAVVFAGAVCLLLARAANSPAKDQVQ